MFRWYQKADVCYAYLSDLPGDIVLPQECSEFAKSRWFTRGWTLQELIAPSNVGFYSKDWHSIGTKDQLCDLVATITGIDVETLRGQDLELVSVAQKMSWAAQRTTSRVEDIAYCLLGIFDVNMPLLYGEGKKAFLRLGEEILKLSNDHSLFAWGMPPAVSRLKFFEQAKDDYDDQLRSQKKSSSKHSHPNSQALERPLLRGLLADSPAEFTNSGKVVPLPRRWAGDRPPTAINRGIQIELPFISEFPLSSASMVGFSLAEWAGRQGRLSLGALSCHMEDDYCNVLGLALLPLDSNSFGRLPEPVLLSADHNALPSGTVLEFTKSLHIKPGKLMASNLDGNIVIRKLPSVNSGYNLSKVHCMPPACYEERTRVLKPSGMVNCALAAFIFHRQTMPVLAVVLGRISRSDGAEETLATCFFLRRQKGAAEDETETKKGMTESELLHSMTLPYEHGSSYEASLWLEGWTYLVTSIMRVESSWRTGVFTDFVDIKIEKQIAGNIA
jgi:hypothetical protein